MRPSDTFVLLQESPLTLVGVLGGHRAGVVFPISGSTQESDDAFLSPCSVLGEPPSVTCAAQFAGRFAGVCANRP